MEKDLLDQEKQMKKYYLERNELNAKIILLNSEIKYYKNQCNAYAEQIENKHFNLDVTKLNGKIN